MLIVVGIPILLFFLVRFGDTTIKDGEKIIFGYSEKKGRFQIFEYEAFELEGIDGPHIIGSQIFTVNDSSELSINQLVQRNNILVKVDNEDRDVFQVNLKNTHTPPPHTYPMPERLIAISDIEGNFNGFSSFLQTNAVIDSAFNWNFGTGHLVLIGDFVDRGKNVLPVLWLIYKLEQQATEAGGHVHFILGNHELMNIHGNFKYAEHKYRKIAEEIGKKEDMKENFKSLFAIDSELGKWMRSKNIIEKIGDYIFVHAGLSPEILPLDISINEMNTLLRNNIDEPLYHKPKEDERANFVMGRKGPYWYRGCVKNYKYYPKIKSEELDTILQYYDAKKMMIGHSVVEDVSTRFDEKLIRIDVKHGTIKQSGKTKGVLIENEILYKVDDLGNKSEL